MAAQHAAGAEPGERAHGHDHGHETVAVAEEEVQAFLTAHGPLLFDAERDAEPEAADGKVAAKERARQAVKTVATRLPLNMALGVVTGVPGIAFGVGSAVAGAAVGKVQASRHARKVAGTAARITVAPLRAEGLANPRAEHTGRGHAMLSKAPPPSPYIKVALLTPGADPHANAFHAKTRPHHGGGTDFAFKKSNTASVGVPDVAGLAQGGLLIEVKDKPELALGKALTGRSTHIGRTIIHLHQLQAALTAAATGSAEDGVLPEEGIAATINAPLYRDAEWADPAASPTAGMVRLEITLAPTAD